MPLIGAIVSSGCAALLPTAHQEVLSPWQTYQEATVALSQLTPYEVSREAVHLQGLNPQYSPMVKVLHFADVMQRLSPAMLLRPAEVDQGIHDCWNAGQRCTGYALAVRKVSRTRVGNFWLDSLNFKRVTVTTGWSVDALLVFVDDQLVYALVGGQPTIVDREEMRHPLGPLQAWGGHLLD